jgi:hypothetical protein
MRLLELTPAEIAFLTPFPVIAGCLQTRLSRKFAATLTARLRLPVQAVAVAQSTDAPTATPAAPCWQPDATLAALWLTRRLGGQHAAGAIPFVPSSLIHTLDAVLAECWLDVAATVAPPSAMAWHITVDFTRATLVVQVPRSTIEMTRWAQGVIRHG